MKRARLNNLQNWGTKPNRKPLILRGARQVGKTYLVNQYAQQNFTHFININFEDNISLQKLFTNNTPKEIVQELSLLYNTPVIENETLFFFDEIQFCPAAISMNFNYGHPQNSLK